MVDFDKLFEEYFRNWYAKNKDKITPEDAENNLPEVYEEWVTTPCKELDGQSPEQYLLAITDVKVLIDAFSEGNDSSLLLDRMMDMPECVPYLIDLIKKNDSVEVTVSAMDLIEEMNGATNVKFYTSCIEEKSGNDKDPCTDDPVYQTWPTSYYNCPLGTIPTGYSIVDKCGKTRYECKKR